MKITTLGTGGPRPDPERQGPATLVQASRLSLLFDAGRGVTTQLVKAGVRVEDLDAVFITHHHFDHIGGLGDLIMSAWNNRRTKPLLIAGPTGTAAIVDAMLDHVYARDINFRIAEEWALGRPLDHPREMLEMLEVGNQRIDLSNGVAIIPGQVEHGSAGIELSPDEWSARGYRVSAEGRHLAISGDAVAGLDLESLTSGADALVMCAYLSEDEITTEDDRFLTDKVLAGAPQAAAIANDANVPHLVLTHIRQKSPDEIARMASQVARIYSGELTIAHDLLTIDLP